MAKVVGSGIGRASSLSHVPASFGPARAAAPNPGPLPTRSIVAVPAGGIFPSKVVSIKVIKGSSGVKTVSPHKLIVLASVDRTTKLEGLKIMPNVMSVMVVPPTDSDQLSKEV